MRLRYSETEKLNHEKFRRLTGVKRETFSKMVTILKMSYVQKRKKGGRQSSLSVEDMLLKTLEYLREYRTYFHIANSYGISEFYAYKLIRWVENELIQLREFSLPGKKALYGDNIEYEVILTDATESPIQRPQENKNYITPGKRKNTP